MPLCNEKQIVELNSSDYDRLADLWRRGGLIVRWTGRDSREAFSRQLDCGVQTVLGMLYGDSLVGAVIVSHDSRKGWINRLVVDPDFRRQRIGSCLINAAESFLHQRDIDVIAVLILEENSVSRFAFSQAGYLHDPAVGYYSKRKDPDA